MFPEDGDRDAVDGPDPVAVLLGALDEPRGGYPVAADEASIRDELERVHLPMLEEAGYVEWNRETGEIRKGPNFDEVESLLSEMEEK